MSKYKSTNYPGVRYREHTTRKHGIKPDQYFFIRYQKDGARKEEGVGWASEGWTPSKVALKLAELKSAATTGEGESRLSDVRAKVEAEKQAEQARQEQEARDNVPLSTYFKEIYYPAISKEKKKSAHVREESLFRLWVDPTMGHKPLKDISAFDLERLKKTMLDAGRAPRSVEYTLTTLGQIFRHAERLDYYQGDIPTNRVKKPKYDNKRVRFLSHDEAHALLEILQKKSPETYEMALLSLHCGLRAGEIFSLAWKDVDLDHGLITLLDTKSSKTRTLSMTADIQSFFMAKYQGEKQDLVFPDRKTGGIRKQISKSFPRAVSETGLNNGIEDRRQRVTFHTLRHTFASWLVMNGISLYDVKELLGHATLTMTERYAHLAPDRNKKAAATMEQVFQKKSVGNVVNMR
ncbi:MAG: site-specific integrase [Desulfobacter postgatei]|uniref:tyrosine-type recombinase/integrase n=1 Tax=Desulfobacter postgatei TaxID=2293 RepID=UPI0023F3E6E0|nr:site-specific integrase [Desulfobacter postgatei]MDD4274951.1 site-specific integrase [Desulfobacter postgatei]